MDTSIALLTLLHLCIAIYWLGGDLGAFYGSTFMTDPKRSVAERMMAVNILNNIDMAPRTALILAFPTGLTLAWVKGWLQLPGDVVAIANIAFLLWLTIAWAVHLAHGNGDGIRRVDIAIRYAALLGFGGAGLAGLVGAVSIPFFIAAKLCILALCVGLGLIVRRQLAPLFVAIRTMVATGPTRETDATIAAVNGRARVSVLAIWVLVLAATFLGIATPI